MSKFKVDDKVITTDKLAWAPYGEGYMATITGVYPNRTFPYGIKFQTSPLGLPDALAVGEDEIELVEPAVIEQANNIVDMVNEPPHYKRDGYEVIDVLAAFFPDNPLLWQVGKYIMRVGHKNDTVEDLKKAEFYLKREIARLETI